ncbi:phosphoribosyltransferase [Sphingomonas crocodyli]|uniref:Phosphoribosyltransferase n=1 Tax=Sphingomonas crocodyli TaxID=1979270 RepID=A0A437LUY5_9SPHN|nr:phosphoribosyltransferase domain-containing protein [Sphingomonas crocodyli]RVT89172.1 phosphoribosyltransferase [Sphingomonas crocodyli]
MPTLTPVEQAEFLTAVHYVAARVKESGWEPTFIIGVGRGGLTPAVYLSHATNIPMLSVDYSSNVPDFAAELLVKLAKRTQTGERLLFVDDINDSGGTITHLRTELASAGAVAENIRFGVLIDNTISAERVDYRFRTIDRSQNKDWFVFPWEKVSTVDKIVEDSEVVPERLA